MPERKNVAQSASIPSCLRHSCKKDALNDAIAILSFLNDAFEGIFTSEMMLDGISPYGLNLCLALVQDKITIASGKLSFPDACYNKTVPVLWADKTEE